MTTRLLKLIIFCFLTKFSFGQIQDTSYKKMAIKVNYFGEFVLHPGFILGIDYTTFKRNKFELHWDTELGMFFHKWNNNSFFIQTTIGSRLMNRRSFFMDFNLGLGMMLSTPSGIVYSAQTTNELLLTVRPFTQHLKPSISLLIGYDGSRLNNFPILIQGGIDAYLQSHFNHTMLPHAAMRIGIIYRLRK